MSLNTDELGIGTQTGIATGNPADLNGAVNIETNAYGEQTTPGYKPSGGTKKCDVIFAPIRRPSTPNWKVSAVLPATTCGLSNLRQGCHLAAASEACPSYAHDRDCRPLVSDCTDKLCCRTPNSAYGIADWRVENYLASCKCWHVANPTWNPPVK